MLIGKIQRRRRNTIESGKSQQSSVLGIAEPERGAQPRTRAGRPAPFAARFYDAPARRAEEVFRSGPANADPDRIDQTKGQIPRVVRRSVAPPSCPCVKIGSPSMSSIVFMSAAWVPTPVCVMSPLCEVGTICAFGVG